MSFFSSTDSGITINRFVKITYLDVMDDTKKPNRFSQDLQLTDMELPVAMLNAILCRSYGTHPSYK